MPNSAVVITVNWKSKVPVTMSLSETNQVIVEGMELQKPTITITYDNGTTEVVEVDN